MRRYIVDIDETKRTISIYQTLPEPAETKFSYDLGDEPGKRIEVVGFVASVLELLPLSQTLPPKMEISH